MKKLIISVMTTLAFFIQPGVAFMEYTVETEYSTSDETLGIAAYTSASSFYTSGGMITGYIGSDTEVNIPPRINGVATYAIGYNAFYENTKITSVVIPEGVTYISQYAFSGCRGLKRIVLPKSIITIDIAAFNGCFCDVYYTGSKTDWAKIKICNYNDWLLDTSSRSKVHFNYTPPTSVQTPTPAPTPTPTVVTSASATRIASKIVVTATASDNIAGKTLHIGLFDSKNSMVDYIIVPATIPGKSAYVVFKDNADAVYAKVFLWKSITNMIPEGAAKVIKIE